MPLPASLLGVRPLCGRLPGQTPVPSHLSSPSPVFFPSPPSPNQRRPRLPFAPHAPAAGLRLSGSGSSWPRPHLGKEPLASPPPRLSLAVGAGEGRTWEKRKQREHLCCFWCFQLCLFVPPGLALAPGASVGPGLPGPVLQPSGVSQRRGLPDSHGRGMCPRPAWGKVSAGKGDARRSRPALVRVTPVSTAPNASWRGGNKRAER